MLLQLLRALEAAVCILCVFPEVIVSTGDMSGFFVQRLILALIAVIGARIDQYGASRGGRGCISSAINRLLRHLPNLFNTCQHLRLDIRCKCAWHPHRLMICHREFLSFPCTKSALQNEYLLMPEVAQQPPEPCSIHTALIIISHDA
ncbi:hypothetical protein D3C75_703040 [compost metagenome]